MGGLYCRFFDHLIVESPFLNLGNITVAHRANLLVKVSMSPHQVMDNRFKRFSRRRLPHWALRIDRIYLWVREMHLGDINLPWSWLAFSHTMFFFIADIVGTFFNPQVFRGFSYWTLCDSTLLIVPGNAVYSPRTAFTCYAWFKYSVVEYNYLRSGIAKTAQNETKGRHKTWRCEITCKVPILRSPQIGSCLLGLEQNADCSYVPSQADRLISFHLRWKFLHSLW